MNISTSAPDSCVHTRILCAEFGINCPSGSGEDNYQDAKVFGYILNYCEAAIIQNLFYSKLLCLKFEIAKKNVIIMLFLSISFLSPFEDRCGPSFE